MAQIPGLNKEVLGRIVKDMGLQSAVDKLPNELLDTIQPVIIANPKRTINILKKGGSSTTGDTTIYTTPTDREFYLTFAQLRNTANATADNVAISMKITPKGEAEVILLEILKQTATAGSDHVTAVLNPPILLEKGTNILISDGFTVGASTRSGSIAGYTVDVL